MDLNFENFFAILSALIAFTCVLLAVFLLAVPAERKVSNRFLALFLILTSIELSAWIWVTPDNFSGRLNAFRSSLGMLQMPIFAGFFAASCFTDFRLKRWHAVHLLPFIFALLLTAPGNQLPFGGAANPSLFYVAEEAIVLMIASHVIYYAYIFYVVRVLVDFRRRYREQYSNQTSDTLIWLTQLAGASLFAHTLVLIRNILGVWSSSQTYLVMQMTGLILALVITSWIALKCLLSPDIFRRVDRRLGHLSERVQTNISAQLDPLQNYMSDRKPFLDSELSLASLADQTAMTERELSELINHSLGVHFFDFINQHRIRYSKMRLKEEPEESILTILLESGFNSKSSFNTAFKKHVGMTPSAYRRLQSS